MKKIIVALAAIAMTTGISAQAQSEQQCPKAPDCPQAQCEQAPRGECMFEGITLTDAQKEQIKAIGKKRMEAKKEKKQADKEGRKAEVRNYLAEIKAVLTPEQYVQFLENAFVNKGKLNKGIKRARLERPKGHGPRGPRTQTMTPQGQVPQGTAPQGN